MEIIEKKDTVIFDEIMEFFQDENIETSIEKVVEYVGNKLKEKEKDSTDKYLRLMAEYDNYRKRVSKDKSILVENTKIKMLESILDMNDDIGYALKNMKDDEKEGLLLILNKLNTFLKKENIEEIQTETYDEDLHDVITIIPSENNGIIEVISKGYTIDGKPFRYPKIILGKNEP